jgi:hypothetical protein
VLAVRGKRARRDQLPAATAVYAKSDFKSDFAALASV